MTVNRIVLKYQIINEQQRVWSSSPSLLFRCPLCEDIKRAGDLHEAFLRRGRKVSDRITMSKWNCVVVCHVCHIAFGQTDDTKRQLLAFKLSLGIDVWNILAGLIASKDLLVHPGLPPKGAVISEFKNKYHLKEHYE